MPFYHDGTFHLFYLLDENHHAALGGLGGHQWAHASSTDLIHWTHHPLALGITNEWEGSICTGSTFYHDGTFHAFYATRMRDWTQRLCLATSQDGIQFQKSVTNPFASPPQGYHPHHYRDPFVFVDTHTGLFHMLVTAWLDDYPLYDRGGCLAHLVSTNLQDWEVKEPFTIPGLPGAPECPNYFFWNGWYYLIFSNDLVARYRMSREPFGPWLHPRVDTFDSPAARVMKTAAFRDNRRIGVAWIGTREANKGAGTFQWGGHVVFREIIQHEDGTLGSRFPREMSPTIGHPVLLTLSALTSHVTGNPSRVRLDARQGLEVATLAENLGNAHIRARIIPSSNSVMFGLRLRGCENFESGSDLRFLPHEQRVELGDQIISCVDGLEGPIIIEIVLRDDIIDVCIGGRRCLINRCPELPDTQLSVYAYYADIHFELLDIRQI